MTSVAENQLVTEPQVMPVPVAEATSIMSIIERVATGPNADIDTLERLLSMQERIMSNNARAAYTRDFAAMQTELPSIAENGEIVHKKGDAPIATYSLWEDINDAIKPILAAHGFALSFRVSRPAHMVSVTAVLSHRDGHSDETTLELPVDASGAKNSVQAIGSSTSYGKRYTATLLLNLTSRNDKTDDDGRGAVNNISSAKAKEEGVWEKILSDFAACDTIPKLTEKKDEWKPLVPKGWLRLLQDEYTERYNAIKYAEFEPRR